MSFWRRAARHRSFAMGAVLVALLVATALLSFVWTPYPAADLDIPNKLAAPSAAHWLGTDSLGRDIASLLIVGARNGVAVGVIAVGIGILFGVALGLLAAARRGWVDEAVMRFSDFAFAFPALLTAIMLTAVYGPGLATSITAIGIFNVPVFARITSSSTQPRRAAASRPSATPQTMPMPTAITPTATPLRAPTISSETMSRPSVSVPSQCAADGGCSLLGMSSSVAG